MKKWPFYKRNIIYQKKKHTVELKNNISEIRNNLGLAEVSAAHNRVLENYKSGQHKICKLEHWKKKRFEKLYKKYVIHSKTAWHVYNWEQEGRKKGTIVK